MSARSQGRDETGDPFDSFDAIYCINLDRRPDRWRRTCEELARIGIADRVERFAGVEHEDGGAGNRMSHVAVVRRAQERGLETVLVLEDDVVFPALDRERLRRALEQVRTREWDLLYLGGRPVQRPVGRERDLVQVKMAQTHAYAIHRRAFDAVLTASGRIDVFYADHLRAYAVRPPVAEQRDGDLSDVERTAMWQGEAQRLEWQHFVESSRAAFVLRDRLRRIRRGMGRGLIRLAARLGVTLRVEHRRPRIVR